MKEILEEYGEGILGVVGVVTLIGVVTVVLRVFMGDAVVMFLKSI